MPFSLQTLAIRIQVRSEAVVWRCSVKKVFLDISQNSHGKACDRDFFLIKLQAKMH